ncbi:MAG: Ig-like domain-containing protein [Pseudomonadota bacterium]
MANSVMTCALRILLFLTSFLISSLVYAQDTTTYEYDALGRLIEVTLDDGTTVDYDYDAAGNRESKDVSGGNSPPVAVNDTYLNLNSVSETYLPLTLNDTDPDLDTLSVSSVTQPSNGTVFLWFGGTVRFVPYTPGATSSFNYTVIDGNGGSDNGLVTVEIDSGGGSGGPGLPF